MAYPAPNSILPSVPSYVADTIQRLGKDRGLIVLSRVVASWDLIDPKVASAYRAAIAQIVADTK